MKVGAGEVFTITPRYASPLTASSSRKEVVFPPPQAPVDWTYAPRNFRRRSTPAARRVRDSKLLLFGNFEILRRRDGRNALRNAERKPRVHLPIVTRRFRKPASPP